MPTVKCSKGHKVKMTLWIACQGEHTRQREIDYKCRCCKRARAAIAAATSKSTT